MALDKNSLERNILDGLKAGLDGASTREAAQHLAYAIVSYASDAEILCLPGPILIPGAPPVPSSALGRTVKTSTSELGKSVLWDTVDLNFINQDASMSTTAAGIVAYVASSFTVFSGGGITVTGASVMPPPLANILSTVPALGLSGASIEDIAAQMATIIDAAFRGTIFTGACVAPDGGIGPVSGPLF